MQCRHTNSNWGTRDTRQNHKHFIHQHLASGFDFSDRNLVHVYQHTFKIHIAASQAILLPEKLGLRLILAKKLSFMLGWSYVCV